MENQKVKIFECDAIIFDLDGTLVDSAICIEKMWRIWAKENNVDYQKISSVAAGRTTLETMKIVAPDLATKKMADDFAKRESNETEGLKQIDGAKEILESFPKELWAIATSGSKLLATSRITNSGLPFPKTLVTSDDITNGKPNPEPFLQAAYRLGVIPEKCVIFEDSVSGIEAAVAAGAKVIGMKAQKSRWIDASIKDFTDVNVSYIGSSNKHKLKIEIKKEYFVS